MVPEETDRGHEGRARGKVMLRCRGLLVGYAGGAILPPIDLAIEEGEFWAVVGVNGSGKTTLLRTLLNLLPRVGGEFGWHEDAVLSYVAQKSDVASGVPSRVRDFVRAGCDRGWSFLKWRYGDRDAIDRALEDTRSRPLLDEPFGNLSEGQKGRVRLARALASGPNVLVLDEPTSAVDSVTEAAIFETLDHLRRHRGVTLLVVSHRSQVFAGRATHAIFVDRDNGSVASGAFEEVVETPVFVSRHGPITPHGYEIPNIQSG